MNETQYDRAWQHFNVPKLEIQNTTPDEEKTHWLAYKIKYTQQTHICVIKCSLKRDIKKKCFAVSSAANTRNTCSQRDDLPPRVLENVYENKNETAERIFAHSAFGVARKPEQNSHKWRNNLTRWTTMKEWHDSDWNIIRSSVLAARQWCAPELMRMKRGLSDFLRLPPHDDPVSERDYAGKVATYARID